MIYAPALNLGDTIGVFAPSSYVEKDDIEKSKAVLEERGYKVFIHPQTYERENQSAGTHLQKSLAFQGLWQRQDIKAIWAAGGGNRSLHLLDTINFEKLKSKPKILIGFSDVTALLNAVYARTGITTFHAQVFKNVHKYEQLDDLLSLLGGKTPSVPFGKEIKILHKGKAQGHLVGGNLSLFQYLPQTLPNEFFKDSILFLEDCSEELSKLDRMFLHLKRLGVLAQIKGLALGQFSDMQETGRPFGYSLEGLVKEHTEGLDIPVVMNLPFGHTSPFYPLPVGGQARLDTAKKRFELTIPSVSL